MAGILEWIVGEITRNESDSSMRCEICNSQTWISLSCGCGFQLKFCAGCYTKSLPDEKERKSRQELIEVVVTHNVECLYGGCFLKSIERRHVNG